MTLPHPIEVLLGPPGIWRFVRMIVLVFALCAVGRLIPVRPGARRTRRGGRRRRPAYALWSAGALAAVLAVGGSVYAVSATAHRLQARSPRQRLPGRSLSSIAAGRPDAYLRPFAAAIRAFGAPAVIGFGPEMNGNGQRNVLHT